MGAALLTRSLLLMARQETGFTRENILLAKIDPVLAGITNDALFPLYRELEVQLNSIPGVLSASVARFSPESGSSSSGNFSIEGYPAPPGAEMDVYKVEVGPRFFETLRIPLVLGRAFTVHDTPGSTPVAVVNQTFVDSYFPNENPLGRRMMMGAPFRAPGAEIVGVVGDARYYDLREKARPMVFFPVWQPEKERLVYAHELLIRTAQDPAGFAPAVRQMVRRINGNLPLVGVETLEAQVAKTFGQQRLIASLCGVFSLLALTLASIGIYGTMAYAVARRTTEIGIRMAIGARHGNVLWMVLRDSVIPVIAGLLAGLPAAFLATRFIRSFLYGVTPADPAALGVAVALIVVLAIAAAYLPARRAAGIDPIRALRYE